MPLIVKPIQDTSKFPLEKKPSLDPNQRAIYTDVFSLQNCFRILFNVLDNFFLELMDYINNTSVGDDAPSDGQTYGRRNKAWVVVSAGALQINNQSGATYALVAADAGKYVNGNNATGLTITVPTNASVPFPVGTRVYLGQAGAGQITISGAGGVTISTPDGYIRTRKPQSEAWLTQLAANVWRLAGDLGPTTSGDPSYALVGILLHMDGANGGTSFPDNGPNALTVTPTGVTTSTAEFKFGTASALISTAAGTSNKLQVAHHASLDPVSSDFTVEGWVRFTLVNTNIIITKQFDTGLYPYQLYVNVNQFGFRGFDAGGALLYSITGTTVIAINTWYFVQARRSGNTFALAVNGVQEASTTAAGALYSVGSPLVIGNYESTAAYPVVGYIDDVRFTKVARTFNLPTAPFPDF